MSSDHAQLTELAGLGHRWDVRRTVAENPDTPAQVLRWLAEGPASVRSAVAGNPAAPPDLLVAFATTGSEMVRFEAAGNAATPGGGLASLLDDPSVWVRGRAAGNPSAPPDRLARLLEPLEEPSWVLRAGARNTACPRDSADPVLAWLALGGGTGDIDFDPVRCTGSPGPPGADVDGWYRREARRSGDAGREHALWRLRSLWLHGNPVASQQAVTEVARDPHPKVRLSALRSPAIPEAVIAELTADGDRHVRELAERVRDRGSKAASAGAAVSKPEASTPTRGVGRGLVDLVATGFALVVLAKVALLVLALFIVVGLSILGLR